VTSGEPAGIGPDIILKAALTHPLDMVVLADRGMLLERASLLGLSLQLRDYDGKACSPKKGELTVLHLPLKKAVDPGISLPDNASYILSQLDKAVALCLDNQFHGMVTAPICKATINEAGIPFSGHTEYLAKLTDTDEVVMMLASSRMRVALVTTHLPLSEVPRAITQDKIEKVLRILLDALKQQFAIPSPLVWVAGLNPHAGENGYLGREEIEVIQPALNSFSPQNVKGPFPADTLFTPENANKVDAFLAMYHDQGLSVLKYASFGEAVNITLGLPLIRTSVDHGTAFNLAGTGKAKSHSFMVAYRYAMEMSQTCISV
jgi:4-hydroxythreonine-4-phosphate dehydrogenase